jgi:tRNA/tmRNA/rRNA uracil-C5-methylase (TrmA/RlmC/RlmD family)
MTVTDLAFGGEGVGRVADWVVFVPFVVPGEEVEVELHEVKRNFARGRLVRVLSPSPERVKPPCPYYGECGGCQYQHLEYAAQLRWKHKQVRDLMERVGGFDPALVGPIAASPATYGYRNRMMARSQWDRTEKRLKVGFLRHASRLVVEVEACPIAEPAVNAELARVRAHPPARGGIKVVIRLPPEGWVLPSDAFFQNNFHLLPRLVEEVRSRLREAGTRYLVDAYCGVGFFSLQLGDLVERSVGVELDRRAVEAARANAAAQGRATADFVGAATEEVLAGLLGRYAAGETTVVLDPPRTGCGAPMLHTLRSVAPRQVLYVSCHPATLARDLNVLCREGVYRLVQVTPLDMFPQTQHVECVADVRHAPGPSGEGGSPHGR